MSARTSGDARAPATLTPQQMLAIEGHYERFVGPFETVLDEKVSTDIHLDVIIIPPREGFPHLTLCTMGMSAAPMTMPEGWTGGDRLELVTVLPGDWPIEGMLNGGLGSTPEPVYWPFRWLKNLARLPFEHGTWLGSGHTVLGEPAGPVAEGCPFEAFAVCPPYPFDPGLQKLDLDGRLVRFLMMAPLHPAEYAFKRRHGWEALEELLWRYEAREWGNPGRGCVVGP